MDKHDIGTYASIIPLYVVCGILYCSVYKGTMKLCNRALHASLVEE